MTDFPLLETTAEISVAFTGFIGLFLVLADRDKGFLALEVYAVRIVVLCSITPVFFAVLPIILAELGLQGPLLWQVSSMIVGAGLLLGAIYLVMRLRLLPGREGRSLNYGFLFGVVAVLSCIINSIGWPLTPSLGIYLVMIWSVIGIAAGNFVELLFKRLL